MSKVVNAFKVLKMIHENSIIKNSDIAKELNITDRHVRSLVTQLKGAGIEIKSKSGSTGGYYIDNWKCPVCNNRTDRSEQKEIATTK